MCRQRSRRFCFPSHEREAKRASDVSLFRLAHRSDCLDKKLYPLLTHKHRFSTQKCSVCHLFIGRYVCKSKRTNKSGGFKMNDSTIVVFFLSPDGSPQVTGLPPATPVSSATSVSECCTMTPKGRSWENSRHSRLWIAVLLTDTPLGIPV